MTKQEILAQLEPLDWKQDRRDPRAQKAGTILWYDIEIKHEANGLYTISKVDIADSKTKIFENVSSEKDAKEIAWAMYVNQATVTFGEL
jgi:hypothetical protein